MDTENKSEEKSTEREPVADAAPQADAKASAPRLTIFDVVKIKNAIATSTDTVWEATLEGAEEFALLRLDGVHADGEPRVAVVLRSKAEDGSVAYGAVPQFHVLAEGE